jgi:hypothetical protein
MSENQNAEEPLIIKSDQPHTVSMPEGTNVAVGKKGEKLEPSVRKVLADPDEHVVEHLVMDAGVSKLADESHYVKVQEPNFKGYQSAAEMPDRFVSNEKQAAIVQRLCAKRLMSPNLQHLEASREASWCRCYRK